MMLNISIRAFSCSMCVRPNGCIERKGHARFVGEERATGRNLAFWWAPRPERR